jgi:hypothetical protein
MRDIEFRVRWKDTNKIIDNFMDEYAVEALNADVFIVEQFTTHTDVDNDKIFAGDILSGGVKCDKLLVQWDTVGGRWIAQGKAYRIYANKFHLFKIIGNIHENTELLS